MSIPYLPGWWDEINKGNAIGNLVQQLPQVIQPDNVAQRRLQTMLQQNPMLAEQMSNMDEGTRKLLEQSLGFKNQSPISQLPVGAERQQRELMQGLLGETLADPTGREDLLKRFYGKRTKVDVTKEQLDVQGKQVEIDAAKQTIDINDLNKQLLGGKVSDMKRTQADIDKAMLAYPDLKGINYKSLVRDSIRSGRPVDPALITATFQSEGAKALFEIAVKSELMGLENEYSMRLRTAKDPNTSMLLLRTLTEQANQIETTQQRLLAQRGLFQKELEAQPSYKMMKFRASNGDKAATEEVARLEAPLVQIDKSISEYMQAGLDIQKRTEKYSDMIGLPKVDKQKITDPAAFMQQWMANNPKMTGETDQAYAARGRTAFNSQ